MRVSYLVGKASDTQALASASALGIESRVPMRLGDVPVAHCEFIGVPKPDHERVRLSAPEPIEGRGEGWLYFTSFAAYTEDLFAVCVQA